MPTLFISYKRGTAAIQPLREKLHAAKYRTWYDKDNIHASEDWREAINQGIDHSDAVIVGLTHAACNSEYVQYEVNRARDKDKLIFPVKMELFDDVELENLGLGSTHYLDFTDSATGDWDRAFARLLEDLKLKDLGVTRHDLRRQRDLNSPAYTLHQKYLKRLVERIGTLNLAQIDPKGQSIELEHVYIDSPTPLTITVEVKDWRVVNWWIPRKDAMRLDSGFLNSTAVLGGSLPEWSRERATDIGFEPAPLLSLIGDLDAKIEAYHQENPELKPDEENRWRDDWNNGAHEDVTNLNIGHVAAVRDRLVVLGGPGSGKSTFVKYLALCLAGAQIDGWVRPAGLPQLGIWSHGALTPVYVELRHFVTSRHYPANISENPTADHLWNYIQAELLGDDLRDFAHEVQLDLEHGQAVLILDGLDEVPYPEGKLPERQRQLRELALSLNNAYHDSRIIVASRPYAYEGWTLPGFTAVTLSDFEDEHRRDLATRLYRAAGLNQDAAEGKADALNQQLRGIDPALKDRPLFLTLMATIFLRNGEQGLPARKGALYRESILLLLDRWTQSKSGMPSLVDILDDGALAGKSHDEKLMAVYERLGALAFEVHQSFGERPGTPEIAEEMILRHLKPLGKHVREDLMSYLSENAAVLVCPGQNQDRDVFHFAHRTFQEYLAASHIVAMCSAADSFVLQRALMLAKPQVWREPGKLVGDVLADTGKLSNLWNVVQDLLGEGFEAGTGSADSRWWTLWLAATIADEQKMLTPPPTRRGEKAISDLLRESVLMLVETAQALPPPERALCGRVLSELGDPRPGVGLRADGLPDIAWCEVPAGEFIYQEGEKLTLPTFYISKYPITYRQFQAFIEAEDGYRNAAWWEGLHESGKQQQKNGPDEQYLKFWNHPREDVSWHDAIAFCRWLSVKLDVEVTLPTEQQWEKAARGTDGREFPYGNTFEAIKGNTSETMIGQTSAVGLFPDGASPCGAQDMSGNVWEWCLNEYTSKANISSNEERILRGGSWFASQFSARAAFRNSSDPGLRFDFCGFRVVVGRPPSLAH